MKNTRLTIGQLLKRIDIFSGATTETEEKSATETEAAKKDDSKKDEGDSDDDDDEDEKDDAKKDKKKGAETEPKTAETADKSASDIKATVSMATEDYQALVGFAKESESLKAANVALQAKADQWDAYQAAIGGASTKSDSAGASADSKSEGEGADPHADLRKKHKGLMDGL